MNDLKYILVLYIYRNEDVQYGGDTITYECSWIYSSVCVSAQPGQDILWFLRSIGQNQAKHMVGKKSLCLMAFSLRDRFLCSVFRCLAMWFLRREGNGGITHCQNNKLFLLRITMGLIQSCSTATTPHQSAGAGRGRTQKMVSFG